MKLRNTNLERHSLINHCDMKRKLLYFELNYVFQQKQLFDVLYKWVPFLLPRQIMSTLYSINNLMIEAKQKYEQSSKLSNEKVDDLNLLNNSLEVLLSKFYSIRRDLCSALGEISVNSAVYFLKSNEGDNPLWLQALNNDEILKNVDQIDDIIRLIMIDLNSGQGVRDSRLDGYNKALVKFKMCCDEIRKSFEKTYKTLINEKFDSERYLINKLGSLYRLADQCMLKAALLSAKLDGAKRYPYKLDLVFLCQFLKPQAILPAIENMSSLYATYLNAVLGHKRTLIRAICKRDYSKLIKLQYKILLNQSWFKFAENKVGEVQKKYVNKDTAFYAFKMKEIISLKPAFFRKFYENSENETLVLIQLEKLVQSGKKDLVNVLRNENMKLMKSIKGLENKINKWYAKRWVGAWFLNLTINSFYYQLADRFFQSAEEITAKETFQNIPIMKEKLSEGIMRFFTSLSACSFLSIDLYSSRWLGLSLPLVSSLSSIMSVNQNSWVRLCKHYGISQRRAIIRYLPIYDYATRVLTYLGVSLAFTNNSFELIPYFVGSYLFASGFQHLAIKFYNKLFRKERITDHSGELEKTGQLVQGQLYIAAFSLGSYIWLQIFPKLLKVLYPPTGTELLEDKALCIEYKTRCRHSALTRLSLPDNATHTMVKSRWRNLARTHHPDKCTYHPDHCMPYYVYYSKAYARLNDLRRHERGDFKVEYYDFSRDLPRLTDK